MTPTIRAARRARVRFLERRDQRTLDRIERQRDTHFDAETMSSARTHNEVDIDRTRTDRPSQ